MEKIVESTTTGICSEHIIILLIKLRLTKKSMEYHHSHQITVIKNDTLHGSSIFLIKKIIKALYLSSVFM